MPTLSSAHRRRFAKGDCLRRSPSAWLSVCSAAIALLAAGCGGDGSSKSQPLDRAVAERLATQSDAVADAIEANDGCAAADRAGELMTTLDEAAGRGEVPEAIQLEVERVVDRKFICVKIAPPTELPPPPADDDGKRKKEKKDKKHGHDDEEEGDD